MKKIILVVLILGFSAVSNAMFLDFRSPDWSVVNFKHSYSKQVGNDTTLTLSAWKNQKEKRMSWNFPNGYPYDGIGVLGGYENDEIDSNGEQLILKFSKSVCLDGIFFTDKFFHKHVTEAAGVIIDGTTEVGPFYGGDDFNGESTVMFPDSFNVTEIIFWTPKMKHKTNYSLGGIYFHSKCESVPEPSVMILLGAALLGLIVFKGTLVRR